MSLLFLCGRVVTTENAREVWLDLSEQWRRARRHHNYPKELELNRPLIMIEREFKDEIEGIK